MSEHATKLEHRATTHGTSAISTLKQLESRSGTLVLLRAGEEARLLTMGRTEIWTRTSGTGAAALYEMTQDKADDNTREARVAGFVLEAARNTRDGGRE